MPGKLLGEGKAYTCRQIVFSKVSCRLHAESTGELRGGSSPEIYTTARSCDKSPLCSVCFLEVAGWQRAEQGEEQIRSGAQKEDSPYDPGNEHVVPEKQLRQRPQANQSASLVQNKRKVCFSVIRPSGKLMRRSIGAPYGKTPFATRKVPELFGPRLTDEVFVSFGPKQVSELWTHKNISENFRVKTCCLQTTRREKFSGFAQVHLKYSHFFDAWQIDLRVPAAPKAVERKSAKCCGYPKVIQTSLQSPQILFFLRSGAGPLGIHTPSFLQEEVPVL